ncbi:MAG TPA: DUF2917 domain-containing protein [Burkholderiaceae bacterium]|nr:DUF2917 domain-containing protein [Burkholderiaceae bacterium]
MNLDLSDGCIHLGRRRHLKLQDARGTTLDCVRGTLWITQDNDARDIVLEAGERFVLDRDGMALVQAIDSADVCLRESQAAVPVGSELRPAFA